jgi:hypothetical protein
VAHKDKKTATRQTFSHEFAVCRVRVICSIYVAISEPKSQQVRLRHAVGVRISACLRSVRFDDQGVFGSWKRTSFSLTSSVRSLPLLGKQISTTINTSEFFRTQHFQARPLMESNPKSTQPDDPLVPTHRTDPLSAFNARSVAISTTPQKIR